jgi:hypothetical protein
MDATTVAVAVAATVTVTAASSAVAYERGSIDSADFLHDPGNIDGCWKCGLEYDDEKMGSFGDMAPRDDIVKHLFSNYKWLHCFVGLYKNICHSDHNESKFVYIFKNRDGEYKYFNLRKCCDTVKTVEHISPCIHVLGMPTPRLPPRRLPQRPMPRPMPL